MYKTMPKGNASLQYTILPQSDQFYNNAWPPSLPSRSRCQRRIIYRPCTVAVLTAIFISGLVVTLLMSDSSIMTITVSNRGQIYHQMLPKINDSHFTTEEMNEDDGCNEIVFDIPSTISNDNVEDDFATDGIDKELMADNDCGEDVSASTPSSSIIEVKMTSVENIVTAVTSQTSEVNNHVLIVDATSSPLLTNPATFVSTVDDGKTSFHDTMTIESSTGSFKKAKMPRVTLKLRENETIPQMYMKAGIASYKKGNITTSVLAHGLSLEGLIFKTPAGTIKPWIEKWPFSRSSPYVQWKRDNDMREQIFAILVTLMAVSVIIFCVLSLAQLKASRRRWHNVEEPPLKGRDKEEEEDRSKLLGSSEDKATEEKE